jgi:hypothetical protein
VLNLIITSSIGSYTYKSGAEGLNIPIETLVSYIDQLVIPELSEEKFDHLSLLKAACLKFVYMFRNQIPDSYVAEFVKLISNYMKSENIVN